MAFRAAFILFLISSMLSKSLPYNIPFIFGKERSHWALEPVNKEGVPVQLLVY
jgi:hypothetical protein